MVNPQNSVYHTTIGEGEGAKELYLACYCTWGENGAEEFLELMFVDLYMETKWWKDQDSIIHKNDIPPYVEEVCNTYVNAFQPLKKEMRDLYCMVKGHEDDIRLTASVKSTIDRFMDEG